MIVANGVPRPPRLRRQNHGPNSLARASQAARARARRGRAHRVATQKRVRSERSTLAAHHNHAHARRARPPHSAHRARRSRARNAARPARGREDAESHSIGEATVTPTLFSSETRPETETAWATAQVIEKAEDRIDVGSTVIEMSTDATTGDSIGLQTRQERRHHGVVLLERLHVVALGSRGEQGLDVRHERGDDDRLGAVRRGREREAGRDRLGEARCLGGQHREATARESAVHAACPTEATRHSCGRRRNARFWRCPLHPRARSKF